MFTGPVGPVEVFFYWPEAVLGNFYWPGAIGSPLALSPVTQYLPRRRCVLDIREVNQKSCKSHTHRESAVNPLTSTSIEEIWYISMIPSSNQSPLRLLMHDFIMQDHLKMILSLFLNWNIWGMQPVTWSASGLNKKYVCFLLHARKK